MKKMLFAVAGIILSVSALYGAEIGDDCPSFVLLTMEGKYYYSKDVVGKGWLLLDFYAIDCEACNEELPLLEELLTTYVNTKLTGILIAKDKKNQDMNVSVADRKKAIKTFFTNRPTPMIVILDVFYITFGKPWEVNTLPSVFLVDPEGKIVFKQVGASETLVDDIKALLP